MMITMKILLLMVIFLLGNANANLTSNAHEEHLEEVLTFHDVVEEDEHGEAANDYDDVEEDEHGEAANDFIEEIPNYEVEEIASTDEEDVEVSLGTV